MMKKLVVASLLFASTVGLAVAGGNFSGGFGIGVGGHAGSGSSYANSATVGGSMAQGNVNHTGVSSQHTQNSGGGFASAGVGIDSHGVSTYTDGSSYANNSSLGFTAGQAGGSTGGGVGTDYSAEAYGSFDTVDLGIGSTFTLFTNFNTPQ